jgi:hypothetical protein
MGCASSKVEDAKMKADEAAKKKGETAGDPTKPSKSSKLLAQAKGKDGKIKFQAIKDTFETLDEVSDALRIAGLESSNLVRCASPSGQ